MSGLETYLSQYGYLALFIGTFLEGETILLIAGYMAQRGILDVHMCILVAFCGSLSGDQTAFFIGRHFGQKLLERKPKLRQKLDKAFRLLERYQTALALSFRFFYGLRNVTPFAYGGSNIHALRFFLLNAIGALIWAFSFAYTGYYFGKAVETVLEDVKHVEQYILGGLAVAFAIYWGWRKYTGRKTPLPEE